MKFDKHHTQDIISQGDSMEINIVVLGTDLQYVIKYQSLNNLRMRHHLQWDETSTYTHRWHLSRGLSDGFNCTHLKLSGNNGQKFLTEALEIPGVYEECPECTKRKKLGK
jgi:hypothetical protein